MNIQSYNNGFYFTMLDINGNMISEGQYSFNSGLWFWVDGKYKQA